MILVDTSVWIDHLRAHSPRLVEALEREEVATHPFVVGELACGGLRNRSEVLDLLAALPAATGAGDDEVLAFIEHRRLHGRGIGYVDAHLLAAVTLSDGMRLWTQDKRLAAIAAELRLAFV